MFEAYGLYTHIQKNRLNTALMLGGFTVLLQVLAFSLTLLYEAQRGGDLHQIISAALRDLPLFSPLILAGTLLWFAIAFVFHQSMIDFSTGATSVSREEAPSLYNALENLCISRGLPMPALKIIEDPALNAYASGLREGQYSVSVTRGLIDTLSAAELEAVLGHELTHIRNLDVRLLVVTVIFAGIFGFAGNLLFRNADMPFRWSSSSSRSSSRDDGSRKGGSGVIIAIIIAVVLIALSWGLSVVLRFAVSRSREYLADAGSVELTKNPDAMIMALRKIERHANLPAVPDQIAAFFIESPAASGGSDGLFATHPSVDDRVAALVSYAGGHDPGPLPDLIAAPAAGTFLPAHLR